MGRLKYLEKFLLIVVLFVLPLATVMYAYVSDANAQIATTRWSRLSAGFSRFEIPKVFGSAPLETTNPYTPKNRAMIPTRITIQR